MAKKIYEMSEWYEQNVWDLIGENEYLGTDGIKTIVEEVFEAFGETVLGVVTFFDEEPPTEEYEI